MFIAVTPVGSPQRLTINSDHIVLISEGEGATYLKLSVDVEITPFLIEGGLYVTESRQQIDTCLGTLTVDSESDNPPF